MARSHAESVKEMIAALIADRSDQSTSRSSTLALSSSALSLRDGGEFAGTDRRVVDTVGRVTSARQTSRPQPCTFATTPSRTRNISTSTSQGIGALEGIPPSAQRPSPAAEGKQGGFRNSRTSISTPRSLWPSLGTSHPQARRFNRTGPLATPIQKRKANVALWKNERLNTALAYAPLPRMAAEVDMQGATPAHDLRCCSSSDKPMDLITIEQFERENPFTPPPPRRTVHPLRSTSKNGQFTAEFHLACDARSIPRDFVYHTVAEGCFDVELRLNGDYVDRIGQYASKKDAKEEICKKHLATVELMPNLKKGKASAVDCLPAPAGLDDELWVNLVYEYAARHQLPAPDFEFKSPGSTIGHWTCVLRVKGSPLTPFGGHHKPYMTKMNAKKAAAMEAVEWLRSETKMAPAPDKRRISSTSANALAPQGSDNGLTPALQRADVNANAGSPSEQVHHLALELGFSQPAYKHIPVPNTDAFYNSYAYFNEKDVRKDPRLAGQVGLSDYVYGRKAAQQACAAKVLIVLCAIRRDRVMY